MSISLTNGLGQRDIHFYNYVLSSELRRVQKDVSESPPKQYTWHEWEYFLKLMGGAEDQRDLSNDKDTEDFVPGPLKTGVSFRDWTATDDHSDDQAEKSEDITAEGDKDGAVDRKTQLRAQNARHGGGIKDKLRLRRRPTDDPLSEWSWLSEESPLMNRKTESEWIMERLSATLVRELNRQRKGRKRQPPISMKNLSRSKKLVGKVEGQEADQRGGSAELRGKY